MVRSFDVSDLETTSKNSNICKSRVKRIRRVRKVNLFMKVNKFMTVNKFMIVNKFVKDNKSMKVNNVKKKRLPTKLHLWYVCILVKESSNEVGNYA